VLRPGLVARDLLARFYDAGVLIIPSGERVLRFAPPLIVSVPQLQEGIRTVRAVLADLERPQTRA
jgi:acetylornithine/succinyldiaminopimelate/putrescine aminotransferase